jgi:ATP-dependent helicase/nuclease subunit B
MVGDVNDFSAALPPSSLPARPPVRPPVFNIALHVAFADALAAGLLARTAGDPLALARGLVLLPNRRAVTALTEAFVRQLPRVEAGPAAGSGSVGGVLLPRMVPVGDLDDSGFDRLAAGEAVLAPAVPRLVRRLELARLAAGLPGEERSAVERLRLGDALGEVLDALLAEEIEPEALRAAADGQDLADHWLKTLAFLELIIAVWPDARAGHGATEGATRLAALIDATVMRWQAAPPAGLVVAAGLANPTPALVRLLAAVLHLPQGLVVLPGLDDDCSDAGAARWAAIAVATPDAGCDDRGRDDPGHPQWALKKLLAALGLERADVQSWPTAGGALDGPPERAAALLAALAPAAAASAAGTAPPPAAADGLALAECATAAEEAQVVALALREALERPGERAALITPDPVLARRVAAHCRRWGIAIDSSAGTPLLLTGPGALALALVEAMAEAFAPARLLAVLKHALVRPGDQAFLTGVHRADIALRGVRPPSGLDAAGEAIDRWVNDKTARRDRYGAAMKKWWKGVAPALEPLDGLRHRRAITLPDLMQALRGTLTALAGDGAWAGPEGRQLAALVAEIELHGALFGPLRPDEAPALVSALMAAISVRVPGQGHPRLAILGPVEAQLTRADTLVLAGLNEATWPGRPSPDPWLAPAIRRTLGLPGTARAQGLSAQDFLRAASAKRVLITRARRDAGGPQVASRLWLRLVAQFERAGADPLPRRDDLIAIARALDGASSGPQPAPQPLPNPPLALRPRRISITQIDTLVADPFAFHAKHILKLYKLDALDQDPTAMMRGNLAHEVLDRWVADFQGRRMPLDQIMTEVLGSATAHFPLLAAAWMPRIERALIWAGEQVEDEVAAGWTQMLAEVKGELQLAGGVVLSGRIDRLDRDAYGNLRVVDYKTGSPPSGPRVRALEANQLALGLAIAVAGGLRHNDQPVPGGTAGAIEYWQLTGGRGSTGKRANPLGKVADVPGHVTQALARAQVLAAHYLLARNPFPPKLRPQWAWGDYDHLGRVAEWINRRERRQ